MESSTTTSPILSETNQSPIQGWYEQKTLRRFIIMFKVKTTTKHTSRMKLNGLSTGLSGEYVDDFGEVVITPEERSMNPLGFIKI